MRYYVLIDNSSGNVDSKFNWGDDRELPANYPLDANHQVITILDHEGEDLDINSCYNPNTKTFGPKLAVSADTTKIDHVSGVANITITYPNLTVNENATFSIDGQSVSVSIVNGVATVPFSNQIVGFHNIDVVSTTFYGKNSIVVEVI